MAPTSTEWLRVRGIGRERFAGYVAQYLASLGYTVERTESTDPPESRLIGRLERMNPAVPPSAAEITYRLYPTSGGAALVWETPTEVPPEEMPRLTRLVREIATYLERTVSTESHATAKVVPPPVSRLPWEPADAPRTGGSQSPEPSSP